MQTQVLLFLHERNPRTKSHPFVTLQGETNSHLDPMSMNVHVSLFSFLLGREYRLFDCFILQVHTWDM